jgi:hypothetical protein
MKRAAIAGLLLLACDPAPPRDGEPSVPRSAPREHSSAPPARDASSKLPSAAPTRPSSSGDDAPSPPPVYVKRDRPTEGEWAGAELVQTRPGPPIGCSVKRLGDWVRAKCSGDPTPEPLEPMPPRASRVFHGGRAVELRLIPGDEVRVAASYNQPRTKVYAAWPMDEAEPTVVYVQGLAGREPAVLERDPPQPVPATPPGTQPPPMPGDWAKSTPVNTAPDSSRYDDCDMRTLRGWVRVRCADAMFFDPHVRATLEQFGQPGVDQIMRPGGAVGEVVFRIEPGKSIRFESGSYPVKAIVRVDWPQGADRPSVLALEKKP